MGLLFGVKPTKWFGLILKLQNEGIGLWCAVYAANRTWGLWVLRTHTQIHTAGLTYSLTSNTLTCMGIFTFLESFVHFVSKSVKILSYISKCPFLELAYDR